VNLHLHRNRATVSVDISGERLHRRSNRVHGGEASLKENVAAAVLLRAGWPEIASAGGAFVDPMCGAGTLPIEAALMAGDVAPGLLRGSFGFLRWTGHDPHLWERLLQEARARRYEGLKSLPPVSGYDVDGEVLRHARANAEAAGFGHALRFERMDVSQVRPPAGPDVRPGLVAVNPPYGERMGVEAELAKLYRTLGSTVKEHFPGWRLSIITGKTELAKSTGLRADRVHALYNGSIRCCLAHFAVRRTDRG
jgi:23S rRNA (guanine2445-N2)-methyltransferase / 23S rRNA (guanine2069-N7)-methyltransferase